MTGRREWDEEAGAGDDVVMNLGQKFTCRWSSNEKVVGCLSSREVKWGRMQVPLDNRPIFLLLAGTGSTEHVIYQHLGSRHRPMDLEIERLE
jgi:hypothetical protein